MASGMSRNRAIGWIACVGLVLVLVLAMAFVGGYAKFTGSPAATQSSNATATPSQPLATDQSTLEGVVARWTIAIIEGRPVEACRLMALPATATSFAHTQAADTCEGNGPNARQARDGVERLREAFTPNNATGRPTVQVAEVPMTGNTASVTADDITINGQTLTTVILSHSTGIQFELHINTVKIDSSWY